MTPGNIDFKRIKLKEKQNQFIKIKNTGNIKLVIIEVIHCPEIYLDFNEKIVKPGEEIEVKVVFTPMRLGKFTSFLRMRTNALENYIIIKVEAEVIR